MEASPYDLLEDVIVNMRRKNELVKDFQTNHQDLQDFKGFLDEQLEEIKKCLITKATLLENAKFKKFLMIRNINEQNKKKIANFEDKQILETNKVKKNSNQMIFVFFLFFVFFTIILKAVLEWVVGRWNVK